MKCPDYVAKEICEFHKVCELPLCEAWLMIRAKVSLSTFVCFIFPNVQFKNYICSVNFSTTVIQ